MVSSRNGGKSFMGRSEVVFYFRTSSTPAEPNRDLFTPNGDFKITTPNPDYLNFATCRETNGSGAGGGPDIAARRVRAHEHRGDWSVSQAVNLQSDSAISSVERALPESTKSADF